MVWSMPASSASSEESCRHVEEDTIEHCAVSEVVVNDLEGREWQMPTDSSDDATGGAVPSSSREVRLAEFPGKLRGPKGPHGWRIGLELPAKPASNRRKEAAENARRQRVYHSFRKEVQGVPRGQEEAIVQHTTPQATTIMEWQPRSDMPFWKKGGARPKMDKVGKAISMFFEGKKCVSSKNAESSAAGVCMRTWDRHIMATAQALLDLGQKEVELVFQYGSECKLLHGGGDYHTNMFFENENTTKL